MNLTLRKAVYSLLVFSYVLPSFAQQSLESMFDKKDFKSASDVTIGNGASESSIKLK
ncbi:hypothetical protein [Algoriphagus aquimarinus]|uniref:Uncharacterized protein n=1 Tax=Algoriphagus aquimarinus TaxID=237018 RepID=A0A1I0ZJC6_9BACT|nr:hypothetical protein [Algoriphagus aquimarinus]SFB24498.1 hypothetical protein SAMN04489723_10649 [Algoriphagus aquimarinus]